MAFKQQTRQASPEADEASPAAVGKLLLDLMIKCIYFIIFSCIK